MAGFVTDKADGTGVSVDLTLADPTATHTVEIRDTAQANWRAAGVQIGPGPMTILIEDAGGPGSDKVTLSRSYWVRETMTPLVGPPVVSGEYLVTPTQGYGSEVFAVLLNLKHKLIRAALPRIGGRVYHCLDPRGLAQAISEWPAILVYQEFAELPTHIDSDTLSIVVPFGVAISDRDNRDYVSPTEWTLYIRQRIFDLFDWQSTESQADTLDPQGSGETPTGRKYDVLPGPMFPDQFGGYKDRSTFLTIRTELERRKVG